MRCIVFGGFSASAFILCPCYFIWFSSMSVLEQIRLFHHNWITVITNHKLRIHCTSLFPFPVHYMLHVLYMNSWVAVRSGDVLHALLNDFIFWYRVDKAANCYYFDTFASHSNQGGVTGSGFYQPNMLFDMWRTLVFFRLYLCSTTVHPYNVVLSHIYLDCCILLFWMLHSQMYLFIYLFVNNLVVLSFLLIWSITVYL